MSESILERLRYYARVDPRNTVSVFPGDVIEAVDELLRGLSIGRILDMASPPPKMLSFNQIKGVCHKSTTKKRHNRMGSGRIK